MGHYAHGTFVGAGGQGLDIFSSVDPFGIWRDLRTPF